jgi:hypothetical protein
MASTIYVDLPAEVRCCIQAVARASHPAQSAGKLTSLGLIEEILDGSKK